MTAAPYHWVKKIEGTLQEAQVIPVWGHSPSFPWKKCSQLLQTQLELPELSLTDAGTHWRESHELLEGMGRSPLTLSFELAPLSGLLHWVISTEDVSKLVGLTLSQETLLKGFSDKGLEEGYFSLLALQAMEAIDQMKVYPRLSLKLAPKTPLPKEGALCIDVRIELKSYTFLGRLICPSAFLHAFRQHFGPRTPLTSGTPLRKQIEVDLNLQVGLTQLPLEDLKQVTVGDFIILDHCAVDPKTGSGWVHVMLYNTPIFEALLTNGELKIVDYAHYHEETNMAKDYEDEEEEFNDEDLDDEDLEEDEEYDDEDLDDEEYLDEDEEDDEDFDDEDLEEDEEIEDKQEETKEHLWSAPSEEKASVAKIISKANIPVTLTVELARMKMNLEKLLELQPGNVLNLQTSIDQPLDIRMHGKKIAQGELIKIGDVLGIKVLHIAEEV